MSIETEERTDSRTGMSLWTAKDAARYLACSAGHLANLRSAGAGPRFIRFGRAVRYRQADVLDYLTAGAA